MDKGDDICPQLKMVVGGGGHKNMKFNECRAGSFQQSRFL